MRILVIGAGIVGTALAVRLAVGGARVTLADAGRPGAGTTAGSMAWLNSSHKLPYAYHRLNHAGMRAYAALAHATGPNTGTAPWYHPVGALRWADPDAPGEHEELEERVERLVRWGYPARWITPGEAVVREPALAVPRKVPSVAWFPEEAYVDPPALMETLLAQAREHGVLVSAGPEAEVVGIETTGNRVRGVRLAGGDRPAADTVVCCAGWRSPAVAALAGVPGPSLVPGDAPGSLAPALVAYAAPEPATDSRPLRRLVFAPRLCARSMADGRIYLEAEDLSEQVDARTGAERRTELARELLHRARRVVPGAAARAVPAGSRVCIRPLPRDGHPVVGPLGPVDGLYTVVTHSGVTIALRLAQLVAEELLHDREQMQLAPYRPARFTG